MPQTTTASMLPSEADAALAKETGRVLASRLGDNNLVRLQIMDGGSRATVKLPAAAARLLVRILDEMARAFRCMPNSPPRKRQTCCIFRALR